VFVFVIVIICEQPEFLTVLEQTMALFAFRDVADSPFSHLLDQAQRQKVASQLNTAILAAQCQQQGELIMEVSHSILFNGYNIASSNIQSERRGLIVICCDV
jgi:hypothetical protein